MRVNPEEALSQIDQLENAQDKSSLLALAYQQYASQDSLVALEHFRQNHAGNENLEQNVLSLYAQQDLEGALPLIEEFVQRTGKINALSSLISKWVQIVHIASIAYAETLDESHKQTVFQSLFQSFQQVDPDAGLEWALNLDSKYRHITEMAVRSIQSHNVDAAERMLLSVEDTQLKQLMLSGIAQHRAQGDPQSALKWLDQYEDDPSYDAALQSVFQFGPIVTLRKPLWL
jgi:hypothetical protein